MAEDEPSLPMEMPAKWPRRTWGQRVKAVFTQPIKLPGWAAVLFVAFQLIPDWKSRLDFWLDVAKGTGGYLAMAATVVASPFFMPCFFAAGLAWIALAGEAPRGVQRHHWLRYIGWSVVSICLTVIVITASYGFFTLAVKQAVSTEDAALQHQYTTHPTYWHLTEFEKIALGSAFDEVPKEDRFQIHILCLPDAGSRTYVEDFAKIIIDHDWPKPSANCLFSDVRPDLVGLYVGVSPKLKDKKLEEMPKNLQTLVKILQTAHIPSQWALDKNDAKEEDFSLVVGNAP